MSKLKDDSALNLLIYFSTGLNVEVQGQFLENKYFLYGVARVL